MLLIRMVTTILITAYGYPDLVYTVLNEETLDLACPDHVKVSKNAIWA